MVPPADPTIGAAPPAPPRPVWADDTQARYSDWLGAVKAVGVALVCAYVVAAALSALVAPLWEDQRPLLVWVIAPATLMAAALGGHWESRLSGGDVAFGYTIQLMPLLITAILAFVLARSVRARFETGRENATLVLRSVQALRVGAVLAAAGLLTALMSQVESGNGMSSHAGFVSSPAGGFLLGLVVGGVVALGYDPSQLPDQLRGVWLAVRGPARATRGLLIGAAVIGTLGTLLALEDPQTSNGLVVGSDDQRLASGAVLASAPNTGWWLLSLVLGVPVRTLANGNEHRYTILGLAGDSGWWWVAVALGVFLFVTAGVRLARAEPTGPPHWRILAWSCLLFVGAIGFAALGGAHLDGRVGLWSLEYSVTGELPLAVLLPPLWATAAGYTGHAFVKLSRRSAAIRAQNSALSHDKSS